MKQGGRIPKTKKYIDALITAYGDEAYRALGLEPLPAQKLPPALRARLQAAMGEISNTLEEMRIDPESDEAARVSDEIMSRHGFISIDTKREGKQGSL